jgi:hypothetical protein
MDANGGHESACPRPATAWWGVTLFSLGAIPRSAGAWQAPTHPFPESSMISPVFHDQLAA